MRVIVAFFIAICLSATAKVYAQTISINETNASLEAVFKKIEKQTDYHFAYTKELLKKSNKVTIHLEDVSLENVLSKIFSDQPLDFTIYNKQIIIKERDVGTDQDVNLIIKDQETYTISGIVNDEKGSPLPGATVFIANSRKATSTDETGKFILEGIQPGTYEIVVQMLGFSVYNRSATIQKRSLDIPVKLQENIIELNPVNITVLSAADRKACLELFIKYFIGESDNAAKCTLLNPEDVNLSFDKKSKILEATSDKFLIIENKSLGYQVHYLLKQFSMDLPNQLLSYDGSLYFKELTGNRSQQEKWTKNRELTYEGSIWHFFKAAFTNTLTKEGFLIYKVPDADALDKIKNTDFKKTAPISNPDSLFIKVNENFRSFNLIPLKEDSTELYIIYTKRDEASRYIKSAGIQIPLKNSLVPYEFGRPEQLPFKVPFKERQVTIIHPVLDSLLFDKNGNILPDNAILPRGYWSWERVADLFPPDFNTPSVSQQKIPLVKEIKTIITAIDTIRSRLPAEKLYLHTDKQYYTIGDTLRFKAYLLDADFLTPSARSGLLYVELDDAANTVVKRIMVPLSSGISWGDMAFNEKEIPGGSYTLRAYTNWMRNFGEEYVFKKNIYVSSISGPTLIKAAFKLQNQGDKDKVLANLRFTDIDKQPIRLKEMQLRVMNGSHTLFRDKATTGMDGNMQVNFDVTGKTDMKDLSIRAQAVNKGADTATLTIPVTINRLENTDIQFMPEGGNMVAGISTKIGFKAINEDGRGIAITGTLYNSKQQEVATFRSTHKGMGSFELYPEPAESYTAKITSPGNITKNFALPAVNPAGTSLRINAIGKDSLEITLNASRNLVTAAIPANYYLIGQARGVVCYASLISFKQGVIKRAISKDLFPTGIVRFTLLSADKLPLNERIVYIDHNDDLRLTINTNKQDYTLRDSIALAVTVKDKDGKPVQGTFSLTVTDDSQVRTDSISPNIMNNLLLTSDLKGTVEDPGYYLENSTPQKETELDNLLLTQGWVGYDWKQIFDPKQPQFAAEQEFTIRGKVTNVLNKPVANSDIGLISEKPSLARDTLTDKEGKFLFRGLFPVDTAIFKLQAKNRNGKSFNVGIEMLNEFKEPVFAAATPVTPWYVNSDTVMLSNSNTQAAQLRARANLRGEEHLLKEVTVKEKKIVKDSKNLNGPGEADQILDEQDILNAGKMNLGELLQKNIKGFNIKGMWAYKNGPALQTSYMLTDNKLIHFFIDGVDVNKLTRDTHCLECDLGILEEPFRYNTLRAYLDFYTAEDIKGIEVMYNARYIYNYAKIMLQSVSGITAYSNRIAVIEITTRSGNGPYMHTTPGTYIYRPLPFTLPKQFYRPRYTVKNSNIALGTDLRSTIHWQPNMITDTAGKATVSFFSADKPAGYTVIIEGTDLEGNLGYKRKKIKVVDRSTISK